MRVNKRDAIAGRITKDGCLRARPSPAVIDRPWPEHFRDRARPEWAGEALGIRPLCYLRLLAVIHFHPLGNLPALTSEDLEKRRSIDGSSSFLWAVGLTNERPGRTLNIARLWKQADGPKIGSGSHGSGWSNQPDGELPHPAGVVEWSNRLFATARSR
jgi:hypothetical protein